MDDTLYVNLYMPTTVTWDEMGVSVKQETDFPSEHSKLTVTGSGEFTIKLRVPYWATDGFEVQVNGETICTNPEVSTYVEITRTWESGDVITINMPYTLHLDKTPDIRRCRRLWKIPRLNRNQRHRTSPGFRTR